MRRNLPSTRGDKARRLATAIEEKLGIKIKHSLALDLLARIDGDRNHHVWSATHKSEDPFSGLAVPERNDRNYVSCSFLDSKGIEHKAKAALLGALDVKYYREEQRYRGLAFDAMGIQRADDESVLIYETPTRSLIVVLSSSEYLKGLFLEKIESDLVDISALADWFVIDDVSREVLGKTSFSLEVIHED